ncbi:MAG: hypothetical protein ACYC0F_19855 [Rhodanobacter sp.]
MRVLVQADKTVAFGLRPQPGQGAPRPLRRMDRLRLLAALVHAQHQAAVQQFLVQVDRRGRAEQHHRPAHPVGLRFQVARHRVLAGAGDTHLTLRLQQLQGVAGRVRAFLLADRQHLVRQVLLAQVEQALPGQGRVVVVRHLLHQGHIVGIAGQRRGQLRHRRTLQRLGFNIRSGG